MEPQSLSHTCITSHNLLCEKKTTVSCNAQMLPLCYTLSVCLEGFNNTAPQSAVTKELRSKALNIPLVSKWSEEFVASCQESQRNGKLEIMTPIHFYVVSRELQICCRNCTNPKPDLLITLNLHFVLNTTPPVLIYTVPKLSNCTIIQSRFYVEDVAENETCRRMELQKM
jgi:hypothetical protein